MFCVTFEVKCPLSDIESMLCSILKDKYERAGPDLHIGILGICPGGPNTINIHNEKYNILLYNMSYLQQ